MKLEDLRPAYNMLQQKYGAAELDPIYNGGCDLHPDICFVFMNPTARNIAAAKTWKGLKAPWIGTKNIWDLFNALHLLDDDIYRQIKMKKGKDWTEAFAQEVYDNVIKHRYFITNLGKCTQLDARELPDAVFKEYLQLLEEEIAIIDPKVIILFGNQVSSIVLHEKISVSQTRKQCFTREIGGKMYRFYAVYYPVGNGRFNIDKSIEDINWIMKHELAAESSLLTK